MSVRRDIPKLKRMVRLSDVAGRIMELKPNGAEFKGLCPFHKESNPSFTVYDGDKGFQLYMCHGCDQKGDIIDFMQKTQGLSKSDAIKELERMAGGGDISSTNNATPVDIERAPKPAAEWVHCDSPGDAPAPSTLSVNRDGQWVDAAVVGSWAYRNTQGALLGFTCRVEWEGKKDVIPVSWKMNTRTGEIKLRQGAFAVPRALYGAEMLLAAPAANIVLVEGEKTADAARRIFGAAAIVMTWPGGCKAVEKADWSLIAGRKVLLWPDCDSQRYGDEHPLAGEFKPYHEQPGMLAMLKASDILAEMGCDCRIVAVPQPGGEWPNGHDLADLEAEGWDWKRTLEFFSSRRTMPEDIKPAVEHDIAPPSYHDEIPDYQGPVYEHEEEVPVTEEDVREIEELNSAKKPAAKREFLTPGLKRLPEYPFSFLGYDRGKSYYLPDGAPQVTALMSREHTKLNLLQIASLQFWRDHFDSYKKGGDGVDWDSAADTLVQHSKTVGIWDPEVIRGSGAWWDNGKWAVHLGNKLVTGVEGQEDVTEHALGELQSEFVYEACRSIPLPIDNPLQNFESRLLTSICQQMKWERPISAMLLSGFIFLGPVCGALLWRPHVWVTGGSGAGKSTIMTMVVERCLKGPGLIIMGGSTEPGIRRKLAHDARPIVFDEFEGQTKSAVDRVEAVLGMVTRASSETGADMLQADSGGGAISFKSRAMFIFSSIGVNLKEHAARTRVSVLGLVSNPPTPENQAAFEKLKEDIVTTLTPEYVERLHARAVRMIPVIRKNSQVFSKAAAIVLKNSRLGDQVGTLLAGAYGLHNDSVIGLEQAKAWVAAQDWEEAAETRENNDEQMLIRFLMSHMVRTQMTNGNMTERTISDLILNASDIAVFDEVDDQVSEKLARAHLLRLGIMIGKGDRNEKTLRIATPHAEIKKMLKDSPWTGDYSRILARLPGAEKLDSRKFGGPSYRSIEVPFLTIFGDRSVV